VVTRAARTLAAASFAVATVSAACRRGPDAVTAVNNDVTTDTAMNVPASIKLFSIATYDGSGQAVHPDFSAPIRPWSHRPRYLAITPYPNGNTKFENPSLYSGTDGMTWTVARGTPNPLVFPKAGYLSDPDVVYANTRNELFLYYRQLSDSDRIYMIRSKNGTDWDMPAQLFATPQFGALSPAVVRRAHGNWLMWTVSADSGCRGPRAHTELRRSTDGMTWSDPEPVSMDLHGYSPWHLDVQWLPSRGEFWALVPVKTYGTCATRALYLATSPDGVTWNTLPNAVARAGATWEFRDVIYRSTFAYDATSDQVTLWFSGARMVGESFVWSTAAVRRLRTELFSTVARGNMLQPHERRREVDELFQPPE
jgi:hypothetical protein